MGGFEQLPQAIDEGRAQADQLSAEQVAFPDEELSDEAALAIVLQDVQNAEKYILGKNMVIDWENADNLYRAHVKPRTWPGTDVPRANLGMPIIMETIEKLVPPIYLAFFSDPQPFLITPTGKTSPTAARARGKVLNWAVKEAGFKGEIRKALKQVLLYGFTIEGYGWKTSTKKVKKYERVSPESDEVKPVETDYDISHPTFENLELRNVLFDPALREQDVRKAKFVVKQFFPTADELDDLREDPAYKNIPTREELAEILANNKQEDTEDSMKATKPSTWRDLQAEQQNVATSADPLKKPLEILEYWSADRVITVLQRRIVIRNEENEFNVVPNLSSAFIDVPGSAYGFGIAKLLQGEQRFQQGVVNSWIDSLALFLNPSFQLQKGLGAGPQQIKLSPGKVVNESGELKALNTQSVTTEALNAIQTSEARAERRVGANGGEDMPTQAMRTAEGVQSFAAGLAQRMQMFIETFADLIFVPALEAMSELCAMKLKPSQINQILTEADGKAYEGDVLDVYNATCKIDVLSSTKLSARRAAAQMVPLIMNLVSMGPVQDALNIQGKKFDFAELLEEALELAGWPIDSLIVDMTEDDKKRAQQQTNPAMVKAMIQSQLLAQQHQQNLDEIQETGLARAGVNVVRDIMKKASDPGEESQMAQSLLGANGNPNPNQNSAAAAAPAPVPPGPIPGNGGTQ